jgi:hypothetical protein
MPVEQPVIRTTFDASFIGSGPWRRLGSCQLAPAGLTFATRQASGGSGE